MAFNAADDPLGIAVQGRAQQARQAQHLKDWGHPTFGPLPDPKWDGFFQAMGEQGVTGVADDSVGVKKGLWSDTSRSWEPTFDPASQTSAQTTAAPQIGNTGNQVGYHLTPRPSNNIAGSRDAQTQGTLQSLQGLDGAMRKGKR